MRIAITHDYLNQFGGAERVLEIMLEAYPNAEIHTLFYDENELKGRFKENIKSTSILDKKTVRSRHRLFIPALPIVSSLKHIGEYDLVISNSVGFAKAFKSSAKKHIYYCNATLRYAWDPETHLVDFLPKPLLPIAKIAASAMRAWDKHTGQKPNIIISNSEYTRERIKKFYGRDSKLLHPPVDTDFFCPEPNADKKYYLAVGRLIPYKKFDLIIKAFNILKLPLLIVGDGREYENLIKLNSSKETEFTGFINKPEELRLIYNKAKAFLFPQIEDFGLVAAEALACGTPVIGYNSAGAKEMVRNGENGILFNSQTPEDLVSAIKEFENNSFDPKIVSKTAEKFSKKEFIRKLKEICEN
ncbi:MAG: glycosyltransferase [Candidatus Colwellbacteria bacterium]|jgi:glycosyltransferase involved in cell wall biosynthesis|nr:glycosyltransferase [Candidatus Colwellbacteria bacterium]